MWFYDVQADGWSLDDKRTPLLAEEKIGVAINGLSAEEHPKNNLRDVLARWAERHGTKLERPRAAQSFCVPKADIVEQGYDLSLNRYKEIEYEEVGTAPRRRSSPSCVGSRRRLLLGVTELEEMLR